MNTFCLVFGKGFIDIDKQYRVQVGNKGFFIHRDLQCLVSFKLKAEKGLSSI
jgi:hypothetical protein